MFIEQNKTFLKPLQVLEAKNKRAKNLYILFNLTKDFKLCVLPTLSMKISRKFLGYNGLNQENSENVLVWGTCN